jgi:hypothetical protein
VFDPGDSRPLHVPINRAAALAAGGTTTQVRTRLQQQWLRVSNYLERMPENCCGTLLQPLMTCGAVFLGRNGLRVSRIH